MDKQAKIYVAGHCGLVGSALMRELKKQGYTNIVTRNHVELDLTNQRNVDEFFTREKPEYVFLSAARVGGIGANSMYPADFIYENLMIEMNIIRKSYENNVKKLLFLGSSCIYPKMAKQPIKEETLLTGALEPTNEAYAIAKIAGIKMCQSFNSQYGTKYISVMPTNLYGINDNFNLATSHVFASLIRKLYEAKRERKLAITIWGTGTSIREFLFADDVAEACVFLMETYSSSKIVNIGTGIGVTIHELAEMMAEIIGFKGKLLFDSSKPDGTPVKINDVSYLNQLGWEAKIDLREGIRRTYEWYCLQQQMEKNKVEL